MASAIMMAMANAMAKVRAMDMTWRMAIILLGFPTPESIAGMYLGRIECRAKGSDVRCKISDTIYNFGFGEL